MQLTYTKRMLGNSRNEYPDWSYYSLMNDRQTAAGAFHQILQYSSSAMIGRVDSIFHIYLANYRVDLI